MLSSAYHLIIILHEEAALHCSAPNLTVHRDAFQEPSNRVAYLIPHALSGV